MSKVYLTLGAIVKNEAHYVREWLAHYRAVGFEKFAIVLNDCTDETEKLIRSLSFSDDISISYTSDPFPQVGAYNRLCKEWRDKTFWMAFLDADEFLFCPDGTDVRAFMSDYERHSGLMVHNYEFGSSGHVIRPEGLAITSFLYRAKDNHWMHDQFKCVIRLDKFQHYLGPHLARVDGEIVREDHRAVPPENIFFNHGLKNGEKPICRMIRYNHYHHRSMEDFVARSYRGDACRVREPLTCTDFRQRDHRDVLDFSITQYERPIMNILEGKIR